MPLIADQPLEQLLLEGGAEPEQLDSASSRTCVWMRSATSPPASGRR